MKARIIYRPDAQKTSRLYDSILTNQVLTDICSKVTGQSDFTVVRDTSKYNKGRLLFVEYQGVVNYVSLSEVSIGGRNSSLQSVPTAINMFYADTRQNKRLCYYFMPHKGNAFTDYHLFVYRLLKTAGVNFLNISDYYPGPLFAYNNVDDLIADRRDNQMGNLSNNSSYISKSSDKIQIYAKTFGASKYESTLLAVAVSKIADRPVDLFNICEQDLKMLPEASRNTIDKLGNIDMYYTSLFLDKHQYMEQEDKTVLRSPTYQYNLLNRIGTKRCVLCGCEIAEIVQGAHIWGVAQISKDASIDDDTKFGHAISGHNGMWLCQNHHKLFDSNIILIDNGGRVRIKDGLASKDISFIRDTTFTVALDGSMLSDNFKYYLSQRNQTLDLEHSQLLAL